MALGVKRPLTLSLTPIEDNKKPLTIVESLRNKFNDLNSQIQNFQIKNNMSQIANDCLNKFNTEPVYKCNPDIKSELKFSRTSVPNNFFIGNNYYISNISGIYVYSCVNIVYKQIRFLINDINCFFKIILEICLQIYASSLDCGLKIPKIMDYSLSRDKRDDEETDFLLFQIKMEKIDIIDIKKPENKQKILDNYEYFLKTIKNGLDCFEKNGLYHNDTHIDNIGFYNDTNISNLDISNSIGVVLMDFGKATLTNNNRYQSPSGFYKEIDTKEKFDKWLSHTIQPNIGLTFYGGKKKTKITKKKRMKTRLRLRHKNKSKRRHTKKRRYM